MTDIISTVQKQDPGSELVVLYELEYGGSQPARFFGGIDEEADSNLLSTQNMLPWEVGTAHATISGNVWYQSGTTAENTRSLLTDPFGGKSVIWRAINSGDDNNADGGFEGPPVEIDPTKAYRFSLFINQKNSTNGTSYFGTGGRNAAGSSLALEKNDGTGDYDINPYFFHGDLPALDKWHLLIGYIVPHNDTEGTIHPDSGCWDLTTGQKVNTGTFYDFKFQSDHTKVLIRGYQYYNTSSANDEVQFFAPRIDLVDDSLPSINALLRIGAPAADGAVYFRDSTNASREYNSIPILAEGFDISSDGAYSRPEISIGNIGDTLSTAVGGLDYEDLTGKRVTRITTFQKYLVGGSSDSANAPGVHLPKIVYVIDRVVEKNILQVTFELASPFDLAGVTLPRRTVVGGACTWRYQEGRKSIARANRVGACTWEGGEGNLASGTPIFVNSEDEYVMNFDPSTPLTGSGTVDIIYHTTKVHNNGNKLGTVVRLNDDGTTTDAFDEKEFWQAINTTGGIAGYTNASFRRVHYYSTWSNTTVYNGYSDPRLNNYVIHNGKLWRVKRTVVPVGTTPATGKYWIEGDLCRKTISSCKMRYMAKTGSVTGHSNPLPLIAQDHTKFLPYGGFPGVQSRR